MALQILNRAQAFAGGCDLWILPNGLENSAFKKVDWYLNFQLTRARLHEPQEMAPQLRTTVSENQLPSFRRNVDSPSPLMVESEDCFPTKKIVEVPLLDEPAAWVDSIFEIWTNLQQPPLRVFLPENIAPDKFQKLWRGPKNESVSVVPW